MLRFGLIVIAVTLAAPMASIATAQEGALVPAQLVITGGKDTFKGKGTDALFPREIVITGPGRTISMEALGSGVRKKMVFKVYEGMSSRRLTTDLREAHERGYLSRPVPGMKTVVFMENPELLETLTALIEKSLSLVSAPT